MLERVAQRAPLPCFGLEFDLMPDRCAVCPHRTPCQNVSHSRIDKVPLPKTQINLQFKFDGLDSAGLVESEYQLYHRAILRRPTNGKLKPEEISMIRHNADELSVEPGLLILASLLGHRAGGADRPFYGRMMVGPSAMRNLTTYREECGTRYGTFDASALGELTNLPPEHNVSRRLHDSENLAAAWAIRAALRRQTVGTLYADRELALDPWWLATEPSYLSWQQEDGESVPHELQRHRQRVKLAATRAGFPAVVAARNREVLRAVLRETGRLNLDANLILVPPVITEPVRLWRGVAYVHATLEALKILG
jgi:hypothetical protein